MTVGLSGLVFVVFLLLKLHGDIDWSWWWITAPLWITAVVDLLIIAVGVLFSVLKPKPVHPAAMLRAAARRR